jgi:hypothetical protein
VPAAKSIGQAHAAVHAETLLVDEAVIAPLYWLPPVGLPEGIVHPKSITGYDYFEFWDIQK